MKIRFIATLCIGILFILLISNRYLDSHSIQSTGKPVSSVKVQKVEWQLTSKKNTQEFNIKTKSLNVEQREKIKVFITSEKLKSYKIIEPIYNGKNRFTFKYTFKKKTPYYISIFLEDQTIDTKIFQKNKEENQELFPSTILTKKLDDFQVSLLFNSLIINNKSILTFEFDQFKSHHAKLSDHNMYIVSEDGSYFKKLNNHSKKTKVKYELDIPKEGMYKLFYEFKLNNKNQSFTYILDVKDKDNVN
jgi:hypothetical protein